MVVAGEKLGIWRDGQTLIFSMAGSCTYFFYVSQVSGGREADWGRDVRGKLFTTVPISSWLLVFTNRDQDSARKLAEKLNIVGTGLGIRLNAPTK